MPRWRDRTLGSRITLGSILALALSLALYFIGVFTAPPPVAAIEQPFSWTDILLQAGGLLFLLSLAAMLLGMAVSASEPPVHRSIPTPAPPPLPSEPESLEPPSSPTLRDPSSWTAASQVLTFSLVCFLLMIGLCGYGSGFDEHGTNLRDAARNLGVYAFFALILSLPVGLILWWNRNGTGPRSSGRP